MAHCPETDLQDLKDILAQVSLWKGIKTKRLGIYYFKSKGFLHFHIKGQERWADVRGKSAHFEKLPLPLGASASQKEDFIKEIAAHYQALLPV